VVVSEFGKVTMHLLDINVMLEEFFVYTIINTVLPGYSAHSPCITHGIAMGQEASKRHDL
jgi:hypothetical protein